MKTWELLPFKDSASLAKDAAKRWLSALSARKPNAPCSVALSGGRIASRFYDEILHQVRNVRWIREQVDFFWADERCVPPTDSESNFKLADKHLLRPLAIMPERVHRIRGEAEPELAVAEIQSTIARVVPAGADGQPILDFVFLGMGEDGHIASLFPSEMETALSSSAVYRSVIGAKKPRARITLGYAPLAAARNVWVLASGPGKEGALSRSLAPAPSTPLGRLLQLRQNTCIFTDIPIDG